MSEPRRATGTPLRELFADADRLGALECAVAEQRQRIVQLTALVVVLQRDLDRVRQIGCNDVRLSQVLRDLERRLAALELGGER